MKRFSAAVAVILLGIAGIAAAQTSGASVPVDVVNMTDLAANSPVDIAELLQLVPPGNSYRYADDVRGLPTLGPDTVPFAQPDVVGAGLFDPGAVGFGNTIDVLREMSDSFEINRDGLVDVQMAVFFMGREEPSGVDVADFEDLFIQIDIPIGFEGAPGWEAVPAFPGDTWQGGSLILSIQMAPGEDTVFELIDATNNFGSIPFDGFFAAGVDWAVLGVDVTTLEMYGGPGDMRWAFASHVHDGSYGACETCLSVINAFPQVPRTVNDLLSFPPGITLAPQPLPTTTTSTTTTTTTTTEAPLVTTTTTTTTTTTEAPLVTTTLPGGDPASVDDDSGGSFPWIPSGVAIALLGGSLLYFARRDDDSPTTDCDRLLREWKDAERRRKIAEEFLGSSYENFQARSLRVMELEAMRAEYVDAMNGPRGGIGGLDMVRLDGQLIGVEGLQGMIDALDGQIEGAQADLERAKAEVDERLETYNAAVEVEDAARAAYEACIGAATASSPPSTAPESPGDGGVDGGTTPPEPPSVLAPPISSEPRKDTGCDAEGQPDPIAVAVGPPVTFKLYVDFDVIVTIDPSSQHSSAEHGAGMSAGLKDAALVLGTIGSLLGGAGAGSSAGAAVGSFRSGKMVKGSVEAVTGGATGALTALGEAKIIPSIPTSLPEAVATGLSATAALGALVADKITEWMAGNVTVYLRPAYFYQVVSIQPTQIWECRNGAWECVTRVNVYDVGTLKKARSRDRGPFTLQGDRERFNTQREIRRLTAHGRNRIARSVEAIANWEEANPPGDCK